VYGSTPVLIYQLNLNEGKRKKNDVSAVLPDSNSLSCMKNINILAETFLASNKSMKVLKPCCTLLITNLVSFNYLTTRFTALYQAN